MFKIEQHGKPKGSFAVSLPHNRRKRQHQNTKKHSIVLEMYVWAVEGMKIIVLFQNLVFRVSIVLGALTERQKQNCIYSMKAIRAFQ